MIEPVATRRATRDCICRGSGINMDINLTNINTDVVLDIVLPEHRLTLFTFCSTTRRLEWFLMNTEDASEAI